MNNQRYPEEFKIEAVKQVTERGHRVADVAIAVAITRGSGASSRRAAPKIAAARLRARRNRRRFHRIICSSSSM